MDNIKNEIDYLIGITNKIYSISKPKLSCFNNKTIIDSLELLYLTYLQRIISNIYSVNILLHHLIQYNAIENSIGLILRSNLYDCKHIFYLEELKKKNEEEIRKTIRQYFGENIKHTIKVLKKTNKQAEFVKAIDDFKKNNHILLKLTNINIDTIEKEDFRYEISLPAEFDSLANLYYIYSKYEHVGINTITLKQGTPEEILLRIEIGIHYSLQGILVLFSNLDNAQSDLMSLNIELSKRH